MRADIFKQFNIGRASSSALLYILLVVVLPTATLVIAGLVFLWQKNVLLITTAVWLLAAVIAYTTLIYWPSRKAKQSAAHHATAEANKLTELSAGNENDKLPQQLAAQQHWTTTDVQIWEQCCLSIEAQLQKQPDWEDLPTLALEQLALISEHFHGKSKSAQFQFTLPELLLVVSVTSSRYRQLVLEHIPFIDKFSIATGSNLLDQKENIGAGFKWFTRLRRTARLLNPASAVVGELRDLISNKIFSQASAALQSDLKRLLLQEAVQVGIDLYSGKLATSDDELAAYKSKATLADTHRVVDAAELVRIVLIGQTSSGKSSLANALTDCMQAEVDVLPTTDQLSVHQLHIEDAPIASLIDTPGIDGAEATSQSLLQAALEADLIVWLAKATQQARAPDQQLFADIQDHYARQHKKLQPPVIMALSHIDQLSPKSEWSPPYNLNSDNAKAQSIHAAIQSAQKSIGFPNNTLTVPVYLGDRHAHYNVDALASQIMLLNDASTNVQLNRRRLELGASAYDWRARWAQTKKLGHVIGQAIVRRVKDQ